MREDKSGRPRQSWRSHPWLQQVSSFAAHLSAAAIVATGAASTLAARKKSNRDQDLDGGKDGEAKHRDNDLNANGRDRREGNREQDDDVTREASRGSNPDRGHKQDRGGRSEQDESETEDDNRRVRKEQNNNKNKDDEPEENEDPEDTNTGGGGGGGGNNAGNAGSGFFDSPLATKARRRANDFENGDQDDEEDGIVVDVAPEGESIYETDSITFATGPEGIEILTDNITYFADPTPTPTPLPTLELPVREPGYPFGEDFPFGTATVVVTPTAPAPADPGDTGNPAAPPVDPAPAPAPEEPPPTDTDGGDNTMDFTS